MNMNSRRDFLKGTAWMGAMAMAAGCTSPRFGFGVGGAMQDHALKPMKRVRVGFVGIGGRGTGAVHRVAMLPGVDIVALCDIDESRIAANLKWLAEQKLPVPKTYDGAEGYRRLCQSPDVDVVYCATHWAMHAPVSLEAMRGGKVALCEVPAALTVDECWELVETSERLKIPCMQLENCCYGEIEMLSLNLARLGLLGELVHAEGAYIHDLRGFCRPQKGESTWRYGENLVHKGNRYPTHGLVPLMQTMGINRGDAFDYMVSLESYQRNDEAWMKANLPADEPRRGDRVEMGDMNTTLIKTRLGRSIMVQHDVSSPRPYSRIQLLTGTRGAICDYPFRVVLEDRPGSGAHEWFGEAKANEIREKHRHPLWKKVGKIAEKVGGHGGMDFIMDLRWAYCLQNGLPLDQDVYDLAASCCLCELTEKSVRNESASIRLPDFTCGNWRNVPPLGVLDIDLSKLDFGDRIQKDPAALNV